MMEKEQLVSLVTKAQQGDQTALNDLFNAFYNDVYYFALKTVKDDQIACDVTQETFVEIINTIEKLENPVAFVTWMKQITYHQCTRYFKKKKDVIVDEDEDGNTIFDTLQEDNAEFIPEEALDKEDFKNTIMSIIDELSEEQRAAIMMFYFDEMSIKQIAEVQGVSENTVKSRLNYGKKGIKKSVEEYEKKHNIKLHSFGFLPFMLWLFKDYFAQSMPTASAEIVAEGVAAATGTTITVSAATATTVATATTTATAVGIGAKIAAMPIASKIVAGIVAATIVIGTPTAVVLLNKDDSGNTGADTSISTTVDDNADAGADTSISTPVDDENDVSESDELVLEGVLPVGCVYQVYDGTVLNEGDPFPEKCTKGDVVFYGDYAYGYECCFVNNQVIIYEDDIIELGVVIAEKETFIGTWLPIVQDKSKSSYGEIAAMINGEPIRSLFGTYTECKNLKTTDGIHIPSTVNSMNGVFANCTGLESAEGFVIPSNIEAMFGIFNGCPNLTGNITINASPKHFADAFTHTEKPINLIGSSANLVDIAKTANNGNVTVNGAAVESE